MHCHFVLEEEEEEADGCFQIQAWPDSYPVSAIRSFVELPFSVVKVSPIAIVIPAFSMLAGFGMVATRPSAGKDVMLTLPSWSPGVPRKMPSTGTSCVPSRRA